ncbi:MAG: aldolase/citrate lyase family protein [Rikenellaceae bacterium]
MTKNFIKEKMAEGTAVVGPFVKMTDACLIEQAALAGFDFCIIDMEHGPINLESALNLVRAAELHGMSPIIRTTDASHESLLRALDIGAHGVEVPQVNSKSSAASVVDGCKFFPEGSRGVCRYTRAAEYTNIDKAAHFAGSNANTMVIVHIEGLEGVNNLAEILEVKGLDVIFLGPYDLSQSCGVPGDIQNPIVIEKMKQAVAMASAKGVKVGTFVESAENAKFWRELGVSYLAYSVDCGIYYNACKSIVEGVRNA